MAKPKQPTDRLPKAPAAAPPVATQVVAAQPSPEPPGSVRTAVKLMYLGAALAALDLIVTLTTVGKAKSLLHAAQPNLSPSRLQSTVHAEVAYLVVTWLITIALWIVMARTNLAGKGWARIVSTVLCVISTLSFVAYISQPSSLISKLVLIPMWLVGVTAIAALWRPQTTAYIRSEEPGAARQPMSRRQAQPPGKSRREPRGPREPRGTRDTRGN